MPSPITCPVPSNINPLTANGFNFSITKIPEITYFCQSVNLPGLTLPTYDMQTPLSTLPFSGDILTYDDLNVQFVVDENMSNYKALYNWMIGLGFPTDYDQFTNFINNQDRGYSRTSREYSDATLQILNNTNNVSQTVKFIDIIPVNLSSMQFESTLTDTTYIIGNATFKISRYEFV